MTNGLSQMVDERGGSNTNRGNFEAFFDSVYGNAAAEDADFDAAFSNMYGTSAQPAPRQRVSSHEEAMARAQQPGQGEGGFWSGVGEAISEGAKGAGRAVKEGVGGLVVNTVSGLTRLAGTPVRALTGWEGLHKLANAIDESYANFGAQALESEYGANPDGFGYGAGRFGEKLTGIAGNLGGLAAPGGIAKVAKAPAAIKTAAAVVQKSFPYMFGNNAAVQAYDTARENGKSKAEATALAGLNGAIHFLGFKAFESQSLNKMLGMPKSMEAMMPKWANEARATGAPKTFTELARSVRNGMIKHTLAERGRGMLKAGGIMALQDMLSDVPMQVAEGGSWDNIDFNRVGKKGLEGLEEGALMEGAMGAAAMLRSNKSARNFLADKIYRNGYDVVSPSGKVYHEPGLLQTPQQRMALMKQNPDATERVLDIIEHGGVARPDELDAAFLPPDMSEKEQRKFAADWRKDLEPYVEQAWNADQSRGAGNEYFADREMSEANDAEGERRLLTAGEEKFQRQKNENDEQEAWNARMLANEERKAKAGQDEYEQMMLEHEEARARQQPEEESRSGGEQPPPEQETPKQETPDETGNVRDEAPAQPEQGQVERPEPAAPVREEPRPVEGEPPRAEAPREGVVEATAGRNETDNLSNVNGVDGVKAPAWVRDEVYKQNRLLPRPDGESSEAAYDDALERLGEDSLRKIGESIRRQLKLPERDSNWDNADIARSLERVAEHIEHAIARRKIFSASTYAESEALFKKFFPDAVDFESYFGIGRRGIEAVLPRLKRMNADPQKWLDSYRSSKSTGIVMEDDVGTSSHPEEGRQNLTEGRQELTLPEAESKPAEAQEPAKPAEPPKTAQEPSAEAGQAKETPTVEKPPEAVSEAPKTEPAPEKPAPTNRLKRRDGTDPLAEKEAEAEKAEAKPGAMTAKQKAFRLSAMQKILGSIDPDVAIDPKALRRSQNNPNGFVLKDLKKLDDPANDGWQYELGLSKERADELRKAVHDAYEEQLAASPNRKDKTNETGQDTYSVSASRALERLARNPKSIKQLGIAHEQVLAAMTSAKERGDEQGTKFWEDRLSALNNQIGKLSPSDQDKVLKSIRDTQSMKSAMERKNTQSLESGEGKTLDVAAEDEQIGRAIDEEAVAQTNSIRSGGGKGGTLSGNRHLRIDKVDGDELTVTLMDAAGKPRGAAQKMNRTQWEMLGKAAAINDGIDGDPSNPQKGDMLRMSKVEAGTHDYANDADYQKWLKDHGWNDAEPIRERYEREGAKLAAERGKLLLRDADMELNLDREYDPNVDGDGRTIEDPDSGRVVGTFNRETNKLKLFRGATIKTLVHELGGHATLKYAEQLAERGDRRLLDRINRVIDEAETAAPEWVESIRERYKRGKDESDAAYKARLRDEVWAAIRERNSPEMEKAIKTLQGKAWYNRAWAAFRDAWKGLLSRMGMNRADLSKIDKMSNEEFLDFLDRTMAEGKTLGRLERGEGEGTRNSMWGWRGSDRAKMGPLSRFGGGYSVDDAKKLESAGAGRDEIYAKTGWWRGKDRLWRMEAPDISIKKLVNDWRKYQKFAQKQLAEKGYVGLKLEEVGYGDSRPNNLLFKAYPKLKNIRLFIESNNADKKMLDDGSLGCYDPTTKQMFISEDLMSDPKKLRAVIAHEVQHAIQGYEGFARGSSTEEVRANREAKEKEWFEQQKKSLVELKKHPLDNKEKIADLEQTIKAHEEGLKNPELQKVIEKLNAEDDYKKYRLYTGEVEARNVMRRLEMTPAERAEVPPWTTEDVHESKQIMVRDGRKMKSGMTSDPSVPGRLGKIKSWFSSDGADNYAFVNHPADWSKYDSAEDGFDRLSKESRLAEAVGQLENPQPFWKVFLPTAGLKDSRLDVKTSKGSVVLVKDVDAAVNGNKFGYSTARSVANGKYANAGAKHMLPHIAECGYVNTKSVLTVKEINDNFARCMDSPIRYDDKGRAYHEVDIGHGVKMRVGVDFIRLNGKMEEVPVTMKAIGRNDWQSKGICQAVAKKMSEKKSVPISTESGAATSSQTMSSLPNSAAERKGGGEENSSVQREVRAPRPAGSRILDDVRSKWEKFKEKFLDRLAPAQSVQDEIGGVEEIVGEDGYTDHRRSTDYVAAADKANGREEALTRNLQKKVDQVENDISQAALKGQGTAELLADFDLYAQCKHAAERNRTIAERNGVEYDANYYYGMGKVDRGGERVGLSENVANEIVKELREKYGDGFSHFEDAQKKLVEINREDIRNRVASGRLSAQDANQYLYRWQDYVPLKTDMAKLEPDGFNSSTASMRRNEFMKARGRGNADIADSPFAASVLQAEQGIRGSVKNELLNVAANLVEHAADKGNAIGEIVRGETLPRGAGWTFTLSDGTKVTAGGSMRLAENRPDVLLFKRNGELMAIRIDKGANGRGLALSKAISGENIGRWGSGTEWIPRMTHWMSAMRTQYSPEFIVSNLLADHLEAYQALVGRYGIKGGTKTFAKMVASEISNFKALRNYLKTGMMTRDVGEAVRAGLLTKGGVASEGFEGKEQSIRSHIEEFRRKQKKWRDMSAADWAKSGWSNIRDFISFANEMAEYSTRMGIFSALKKQGVSVKDAVKFARDATVNFNRKGTAMPLINGLYMFANASVQGTVRSVQAMRDEHGKELVGLLVGIGVAKAVLDNVLSDDEEREKSGGRSARNLSDYDRKHNVGVPIPGTDMQFAPLRFRGPYAAVPYIAQMAANVALGNQTPEQGAVKLVKELGDQVTDIVGGNGVVNDRGEIDGSLLMQSVAPSVADPIIQLASGKDYKGDERRAKEFDKTTPASSNGKRNTPWVYKKIAQGINTIPVLSGGNENRKGRLDFAPEDIQLIVEFLGAGPARDIGNAVSTVQNVAELAKGGSPERTLSQVPFVRRVVKEYPENTTRYYNAIDSYERDKAEFNRTTDLKRRAEFGRAHPQVRPMVVDGKVQSKSRVDALNDRVKELMHLERGEIKNGRKWVERKMPITEAQKKSYHDRRLELQAKVLDILGA